MKRESVATALTGLSVLFGIVGIVTRPFLFIPIGLLCLLVAAKLTADRRFTTPAAGFLAVAAVAGASIAVGFTQPLY